MTPPTMAPMDVGAAGGAGSGVGLKSDAHDGMPADEPHATPLTEPYTPTTDDWGKTPVTSSVVNEAKDAVVVVKITF